MDYVQETAIKYYN